MNSGFHLYQEFKSSLGISSPFRVAETVSKASMTFPQGGSPCGVGVTLPQWPRVLCSPIPRVPGVGLWLGKSLASVLSFLLLLSLLLDFLD